MARERLEQTAREILALADVEVGGDRPWDIQVHNKNFYGRILGQGSLGLGESYMDGWWDAERLDEFICRVLKSNLARRIRPNWRVLWTYLVHSLTNRQHLSAARENVRRHYDLGNDLFTAMLGRRRLYSCGFWQNARSLDEAEEARLEQVCSKLNLRPGQQLLDIGCGWGSLVRYAAEKFGVHAVGITLSQEQAKLARQSTADLPVEIRLQDYREVEGSFDRVVSLGMLEHVGYKNHRRFMEVVSRRLHPHGVFVLHTIGGDRSARITDPWIHKYIFPNGVIPSIRQISDAAQGLVALNDWQNFGGDYDKTLMAWHRNFEAHWPELEPHYGERFYRMWKYYLLASAGAFRAGYNRSWLISFSKDGEAETRAAA
jgi:cyclopropane-fatty-acyl-phospholipid synthase